MNDRTRLALEASRHIRASTGFSRLTPTEQAELESNLVRIEGALGGNGASPFAAYGSAEPDPYAGLSAQVADPYAAIQATPADLQREIASGGQRPAGANQQQNQGTGQIAPQAPSPTAPPGPETATIGRRAADVLEAIDFSGFVAGLVTGTFQAIVDATGQQIREYADLVSSIARSVDDFSRDNVSDDQVRQHLAERHGKDLRLVLPEPGKSASAKILPRSTSQNASPAWLEGYGLDGEELTEELTEGALIQAGRRKVGEDRMQTLATMVLLGINRIVVDEGHIRAKMQFHASALDQRTAEMAQLVAAQQVAGIAGRQVSTQPSATTMVSTVKANAQADASIRADLMGEVHIQFSTQTFPLERFADSAAIQLINRHARWQPDKAEAGAKTQAPPPKEGS